MARIGAATPITYGTPLFSREWNLQYFGDDLLVTGVSASATSWLVRDDNGVIFASGAWPASSSHSIGIAGSGLFKKYGHFRLEIKGPDVGDGAFGTDYGTAFFTIAEDVPWIPKSPLRSDHNPLVTESVTNSAILGHACFCLGSTRIAVPVQSVANRQQSNTSSPNTTTISASLTGGGFGGATTVASMVLVIHVVVGDSTGIAISTPGFTQDFSANFGFGVNRITVRAYRSSNAEHPEWGAFGSFPTITCTTTNAAKHTLYITELGGVDDLAPIGTGSISGNGNTATLTKDMTSLAPGAQEYIYLTGITFDAGSFSTQSSTPPLTTYYGDAHIEGTIDPVGGGQNHSTTYNLSTATNYLAFALAYKSRSSYSSIIATAKQTLDNCINGWAQYASTHRPRKLIYMTFGSEGTSGTAFLYSGLVAQLVHDLEAYRPGAIGVYEGRNEPNFGITIPEIQSFSAAVRAGNASAYPGGPTFVSASRGSGLQGFMFSLSDAGMYDSSTGYKAATWHGYNQSNGDISEAITVARQLAAGFSARGLNNIPKYITEVGEETAVWPGILLERWLGHSWITRVIANEVILGLPIENYYWFYDYRVGFDVVTTWGMANGVYLHFALQRALGRELDNKVCQEELNFGAFFRNFMVGGRWENPDDHSGVVTIIGVKGLPDFSFSFGTTDGSIFKGPVEVVDHFGNVTSVSITDVPGDKSLTITPGEMPTYIRLPPHVRAYPRPQNRGISYLSIVGNSKSDTGEATGVNLGKLTDGLLLNPYAEEANQISPINIYQTASGLFPREIKLFFDFPKTLADTIVAYCPGNWNNIGVPSALSIDYTLDGTNWVIGKSWDQRTDFANRVVKNYDINGDTMVDLHVIAQHYFEITLPQPLLLKSIRLTITDATHGWYLTPMAGHPTGAPNSADFPPNAWISEIYLLNSQAHKAIPAGSSL